MVKYLFVHYNLMLLVFFVTKSLGDSEGKYSDYITECKKEYPVTQDDLEQFLYKKIPDNDTVKCLFACIYKKTGIMDDEGKMSVKGTRKIIKRHLADNPAVMKKAYAFAKACESVNEEAVSDGTKGCERTALMFRCSIEKAPKLDILA
ncbi:unnamed protein product [Parnassius apollo]|uniref:(apollo) hypothetical protein n=1 Tax=Parnassius apollo TaxID=110799 RepID=A0A8S3X2I7_PARAO|nr:unnamed protein product [Parnassius apollo]